MGIGLKPSPWADEAEKKEHAEQLKLVAAAQGKPNIGLGLLIFLGALAALGSAILGAW